MQITSFNADGSVTISAEAAELAEHLLTVAVEDPKFKELAEQVVTEESNWTTESFLCTILTLSIAVGMP